MNLALWIATGLLTVVALVGEQPVRSYAPRLTYGQTNGQESLHLREGEAQARRQITRPACQA